MIITYFKSSDVAHLKPSYFNKLSPIFGMVYGLYFNYIFKFRKLLKNAPNSFLPLAGQRMGISIKIHFHVK